MIKSLVSTPPHWALHSHFTEIRTTGWTRNRQKRTIEERPETTAGSHNLAHDGLASSSLYTRNGRATTMYRCQDSSYMGNVSSEKG
jgi:hypothetical protein